MSLSLYNGGKISQIYGKNAVAQTFSFICENPNYTWQLILKVVKHEAKNRGGEKRRSRH